MCDILDSVISKIESQQETVKDSAAWFVGEQLKDMCTSDKKIAELLDKDLDVKAMSIADAERRIKEYADNHRKGKCGFVPPKEADRILREFYGLPGIAEEIKSLDEQAGSKIIDLTAFL